MAEQRVSLDEDGLLQVLERSALPECQMAASLIRKKDSQIRRLLEEHGPERDRLVQRVYDAEQARDAAKAETAAIWARLEVAEAELDKMRRGSR